MLPLRRLEEYGNSSKRDRAKRKIYLDQI
jgi:hypothetical protein